MYLQNVISFWFLMYVVHTSPSTSSQEALDSATWEVPSNCSCALNVIFLRHFNEILYSCTCVTNPCLCMHFKLCYTWENSLVSQSCYRNMFKTFNWWSSNRCCHNSKLHMCNIPVFVYACSWSWYIVSSSAPYPDWPLSGYFQRHCCMCTPHHHLTPYMCSILSLQSFTLQCFAWKIID